MKFSLKIIDLIYMAKETAKQENVQGDAKEASTSKISFLCCTGTIENVLGQNLTLRGPSCDTLDSLKGREPTLKGFPIPHKQLACKSVLQSIHGS